MSQTTLRRTRWLVFALLLMGILGIASELLLLEHFEGFWQKTPLVVLTAGGAAAIFQAWSGSIFSVRLLRLCMFLFIVGGVIGLVQHYRGNMAFELEMHPAQSGLSLFWLTIRGATPALAPGTLVQLGLLGLLYVYLAGKEKP